MGGLGLGLAAVVVMASFVEKHFTVEHIRCLSYWTQRRMKRVWNNDCISATIGHGAGVARAYGFESSNTKR